VPRSIGAVVSRRLATPRELETYYGAEDLQNMLEVIAVDGHNQYVLSQETRRG
jgi:hypothetical protein